MVGMSGGVDSTVAALLLQKQGYEVVGVTFRLWEPEADTDDEDVPESSCCSIKDIRDAKMACDFLGIPHYVFNYKDMFKEKVVDPFAEAYSQGKTPNPCIACNQEIKFNNFLKRALGMGYDYIATGHYVNVERDEENGIYHLKKATHLEKDQSYVLYGLTNDQLKHVLMPLGEYSKDEIRKIAEKNGLKVSSKPDSQDICFIPDGDYAKFLDDYTNMHETGKGDFTDTSGNVIGEHQGIHHYTVGQRKGLGMSFGKPMFVKQICKDTNTVVLAENEELFAKSFSMEEVTWVNEIDTSKPVEAEIKVRYAADPIKGRVEKTESGYSVVFDQPVRAITPGQAAVFYDGDYVLGGGTIVEVL